MRRYNYELPRQQAEYMEDAIGLNLSTIVDTCEWEDALMALTNQAIVLQMYVEEVLEDESNNIK